MRINDLRFTGPSSIYKSYIDLLGDVGLMGILTAQLNDFPEFIRAIPSEKWHYPYQIDKWSTVEVLLHILDTERVFQYRALRFARGDDTDLPGFDQEGFIRMADTSVYTSVVVIMEYLTVRNATISLNTSLDTPVLYR